MRQREFPDVVDLKTPDGTERLENDAVIVCAGGVLPTPFLEQSGVNVVKKFGEV